MWLYKKEKWLFECCGLKKCEDIIAQVLGVPNAKIKNQTTSYVLYVKLF